MIKMRPVSFTLIRGQRRKNFILNLAIEDDLEQIEKYIEERRNNL